MSLYDPYQEYKEINIDDEISGLVDSGVDFMFLEAQEEFDAYRKKWEREIKEV